MTPKVRTSGIEYPSTTISADERFTLWQRNVVDKYKDLPNEKIKEDMKKSALPCGVMMSQIEGDFNFANVIRTANNFNVGKVFYFGNKKYDRRAAQGCYHYSDVIHLSTLDEIKALKNDYVFVGFENNVPDVIPIETFEWQPNSIVVIGEEGNGIAKEVYDILDYKVTIPTRGSIRSLNVASAYAIAIMDYWMKVGRTL